MTEVGDLGKRKPQKPIVAAGADGSGADKWWEQENIDHKDQKNNWTYLEHHGVQFPAEYVPTGATVTFEGQPLTLKPIEEELAVYWCQSIGTEWETKPEYRENFSNVFASALGDKKYTKLEKFNFDNLIKIINERKEERKNELVERKNWTSEQKLKFKKEKEAKDTVYGYAIVDYVREKVGGYTIEPPTLFKGRGVHPKSGYFKPRTYPEDLTINVSEDAPVPKCSIPGRAWKEVVNNPEVTWLAMYKDEAINSSYKYFFLSANSRLKGLNDMKKYEKSRRLRGEIERIRKNYMDKALSKNTYDKQLGTVTYFIDKLALRVGNEKNDDEEADTVGCCSLRVEHVELLPDDQVKFDFLGKDSMRYENTVKVDPQIYNNVKSFLVKKERDEDLFDQVNPARLNEYLSSLLEGLTAKVFRTFNASFTLDKELNETKVDSSLSVEEKYKLYNDANKKVAILCNHQKTVNKDFDTKLEKFQLKVKELEDYLSSLNTHLGLIKKGKKGLVSEEEIPESSIAKIKKKYPSSVEATSAAIEKLEERIMKEKFKLDDKVDTKNVALGTSKINYNDPRITASWCKRNAMPIERVFSKELRSKFTWAMSCEPTWRF